jgi:hypothetical protein
LQGKQTSREWDLNRPDALLQDGPARCGDDDPRCGPSSLQKFTGEDLSVSTCCSSRQQQAAAARSSSKEQQQRRQQAAGSSSRQQQQQQASAAPASSHAPRKFDA